MPSLSASALIGAPRGARLCFALACELEDVAWQAGLVAARHPSEEVLRKGLVRVLEGIDPSPLSRQTDVLAFAEAGRRAVGSAMYWQEPDDFDVMLRNASVRAALRPVAKAVAQSPSALWWTQGVDLTTLRCSFPMREDEDEDEDVVTPDSIRQASTSWDDWRRQLQDRTTRLQKTGPESPESAPSGFWWSTPSKPGVLTTTRALPRLGAVEMIWEEDDTDPQHVDVWKMATNRVPRVLELDRPEAWIDLVRRYPLDTTGEHRGDWYSVTGRDGTWHTPDWASAAADYDAVHLTVAGYLTTASQALDLTPDGKISTMLAGWNPDQTWWLNDVLTEDPAPEHWTRNDEFGQHSDDWHHTPD